MPTINQIPAGVASPDDLVLIWDEETKSTRTIKLGDISGSGSKSERVNSLAELRARTPKANELVYLTGREENSTIGAGWFHSGAAGATDDDAITIAVGSSASWRRVVSGAFQADWWGVRADNVDCRAELVAALRWSLANGGTMRFPSGRINIGNGFEVDGSGKSRIVIVANASSQPCIWDFNGATIVPEDIPADVNFDDGGTDKWTSEPRIFHFYGTGSGLDSSGKFSPTDDNCPLPPVMIRNLKYDYSNQTYRGGSRLTPGFCSIQPFSDGVRLMDVEYAINFSLVDCHFKNHYGNGIRLAKCYRPYFQNVLGETVSANQIKSPTGGQAKDHTGGLVFFSGCHGGVLQNVIARNGRKYEADETYNSVSTKGTLCGYVGLWVEYGIDNGTTWTNGSEKYQAYTPWIDWPLNAASTQSAQAMQNGCLFSACEVSGYVLGMKAENACDAVMLDCMVRDCYNPYQITGSRAKLFGCHAYYGNTESVSNPQSGLESFRALIAINDYNAANRRAALITQATTAEAAGDTATGQLRRLDALRYDVKGGNEQDVGVLIQGCTLSCERHPALLLGMSGITIDACSFMLYGSAQLFSANNDKNTFGLRFNNNTILVNDKSSGANIAPRGMRDATFAGNTFESLARDAISRVTLGSNFANNGVVVMDGRGDYVLRDNRFIGAWSLRIVHENARVLSMGNKWGVWPRKSDGTNLSSSSNNPLYIRAEPATNKDPQCLVSIGDVFEVYADANYAAIQNDGARAIFRDTVVRIVPVPSGITPLTDKPASAVYQLNSPSVEFNNFYIKDNSIDMPMVSGSTSATSKAYNLSLFNCGTDSAAASMFGGAGSYLLAPIRVDRMGFTLLTATGTTEINSVANLSPNYVPYAGERLEKLRSLGGMFWDGSAWKEYSFTTA